MKLYENPSDQAAFERWVDITAQLLQKYGSDFLRKQADNSSANHPALVLMPNGSKSSRIPLETIQIAA